MTTQVKPVPAGYHTITPGLTFKQAARAMDWYKQAFGAEEVMRMDGPGGAIMHAELRIGDSIFFVNDEMPQGGSRAPETLKGTSGGMFLYVENVDAVVKRAAEAGAKVTMPPQDMFWGDRFGKVTDPFGHQWGIATHVEDVAPEEIGKRAQAFFAKAAGQHS